MVESANFNIISGKHIYYAHKQECYWDISYNVLTLNRDFQVDCESNLLKFSLKIFCPLARRLLVFFITAVNTQQ